METAGFILAIVAIALTVGIEWAKRPRLAIRPSRFNASGPISWTFAAVQIHNRPLGRPWRWFLTREAAPGCKVTVDVYRWGTEERVIPSVPGRWSAHPEPLRHIREEISEKERAVVQAKSGWTLAERYTAQYDASLDPRGHDVAASEEGEEVAVAVLTPGGAYAWGTESYAHDGWAKPGWKLQQGTYRVVVRVSGSSVSKSAKFKLEYLDEDFAKFRLQRD